MIKLLFATKNVVDVFWGKEGWEPHTRLHISRPSQNTFVLSHMQGTKMPPAIKAQVLRNLGSS